MMAIRGITFPYWPRPNVQGSEVASELRALHPSLWRTPVTDSDGVGLFELLSKQPDEIDRLGNVRRTILRPHVGGVTDVESRASLSSDLTARDKPLVSFDNCVLCYAVLNRRGRDGRETLSWFQQASVDQTPDLGRKLVGEAVKC